MVFLNGARSLGKSNHCAWIFGISAMSRKSRGQARFETTENHCGDFDTGTSAKIATILLV